MAVENGNLSVDSAVFVRLDACGGITLTGEMKEEIRVAIARCAENFVYSENCSPKTRRATAELAKHGPKVLKALEHLQRTRAGFLPLIYEEGTEMAVFFHGKPCDPSMRGDELLRGMPNFIATGRTLVDGATRRMQEFGSKKSKRRPANTHIDVFCREMARIFKEAGGSPTIGGSRNGPFARFLTELHGYLPDGPSGYRPHSADAMVKQAQRALGLFRKQQARLKGQLCTDFPMSTGLDKAFAAALKAAPKCSGTKVGKARKSVPRK